MSGTVLEHRLVRDYLGELDAATSGLPPAQARELREQISAQAGQIRGLQEQIKEFRAALTSLSQR